MGLPRQVTETIKELEALEVQLQKPADAAPAAQEGQPAPTPPATVEPAAAVPAPAAAPAEDDGKWEQRYRTLKGMYDAEVPQLHAQVRELTASVSQLQAQLAAAATPAPAPAPTASLVTDEDVEAFGADLIEVQRKVAREVAAETRGDLDKLRAENAALREQVGRTGAQVAENTFDQQLHRLVPDFAELNNDPKWIAWLDEIDPILRGPRRVVAQDALSRGDVAGVAYYVDMFRNSSAPTNAAKGDKAAELERQIQPRRSSSAAAPAGQGSQYSSAQIGEMFARAARLSATGNIDEARKLEAEIDAAYTEGRVID